MTISNNINRLKTLKYELVDILKTKDIDVNYNEPLDTIIQKTLIDDQSSEAPLDLKYYSFACSPLSNEEIHKTIQRLPNAEFAPRDSDYKDAYNITTLFYDAYNLEDISLKDLRINKIRHTASAFINTSLKHLDLSDVEITYQGITLKDIPTLETVNWNNVFLNNSTNSSTIMLFGLSEAASIKELYNFNTIRSNEPFKSITSLFKGLKNLREVDASNINLAEDTAFSLENIFYLCENLEYMKLPNILKNCTITSLKNAFYRNIKLPWDCIKESLNIENRDLYDVNMDNFYTGKQLVDNEDYTLEDVQSGHVPHYKKYVETIDFSKTNANKWNYTTLSCVSVGTLNLSNLNLTTINGQPLWGKNKFKPSPGTSGPNGGDRAIPYIDFDTIILDNTTINVPGVSVDYLSVWAREQPVEFSFKNTTFIPGTYSLGGFFHHIHIKDFDMSEARIYFPETSTIATFSFDEILYYNKQTHGGIFKAPKLEGKVPPVTNISLARGNLYFSYIDMSNIPYDNVTYTDGYNHNLRFPEVEYLSIGYNLGKAYTTKQSNANHYNANWLETNEVIAKECVIDMFNKLYDLNITYGVYDEEGNPGTGTLYTQQIKLHANVKAQLTPEEIAIATNKGWTVV